MEPHEAGVASSCSRDGSQALQKIFILLRDRTGNDFALYKKGARFAGASNAGCTYIRSRM